MSVIHWPTFADGLFWCACDNRTFDSEEAWQQHVVDSVLEESREAKLDATPEWIRTYHHRYGMQVEPHGPCEYCDQFGTLDPPSRTPDEQPEVSA